MPIPDKHHSARPIWLAITIFLTSFLTLQLGWSRARGTDLEHWVIDGATVRTSVAIVNALTPAVAAEAHGASILAPGGGVTVLDGCEGTEVLFLLFAALAAYPFSWTVRMGGLVAGTVYVFVINQLRLVALFYAIRSNPALFAQLHAVIAPLVLILCTLLFFSALRSWDQARRPAT